ncbi:response regulator [Flavobacterium sp. Sd200]|uniref:hybrid sensor histidine kinase/response regulator transcription factor n=1 Tax=Flavobacterium sp. Sd200 TaxID=2692211 RepID=UPI00136E8E5E|nr:two-component regulator propeller domain-containing protein [Flavobacterium sp. Sd200]MXN93289.1 response regulator [Flavobacterium sp. Sd200]
MKRLLLFVISILLLYSLKVQCQELPLTFLDITNGLSNNSVITMHQDNNGFMWFGTYDGLNRYDGYNFKVYRNRIGDTTSLISNTVYCIQADTKNNIWVGGSKGAAVLDQISGKFTPLTYSLGKKQKALSDITHQIKLIKNGNVLIATQKSGLIAFNKNTHAGTLIELRVNNKRINSYDALAIEPVVNSKFCWVFVKNIGLCKYDTDTDKLSLQYASDLKVNCLETAGNNNLWLGADDGFYFYDAATGSLSANFMANKSSVTNILNEKGTLWIATDGAGVYTYNKSGGAVPYKNGDARIVKSNSVWSLYLDDKANKWIGTLRGGISVIGARPIAFKHIKYKGSDVANPTENFILSFCEDEKNNLWIGTDGAGLRYWDRKNDTYVSYNKSAASRYKLSSNFITSIIKDPVNRIWLSTWAGGVNRIDPKNGSIEYFSCYNPETKQVEKNVWFLYQDSKKNIWAGATNEGSLYKFNNATNSFELFSSAINNLQCLIETKDGKLWGGNYTSLISIDPKTGQTKNFSVGYPVRCVLEDRHNNLWIGTQEGGLLLFERKKGKFSRFTTESGLTGNTVLRLLEDKNGNLWMSTYNGLSRFNYSTKTSRNFTVSDGLQSNQFSFNAGLALSSGEFLFGGINGFNIFYPNTINEAAQAIPIRLTGLLVNNNPIQEKDGYVTAQQQGQIKNIQLPFEQTNLSIEYVALDYAKAGGETYSYLLEGWDEHWSYSDNGRKANYTHLHEGNYIFKVRTRNANGKWDKAVPLLNIRVLPPWYRTWWAYALYCVTAAAIVYAYIRYNRSKVMMKYKVTIEQMERKKEKELADKQLSMFTYISHEFRTPLSLIIDPLKRGLKENMVNAGFKNDLAVAHRNARRLLSLVDQLLLLRKAESDADALKLSEINLNELCHEVFECFTNQAREREITYSFEATPEPVYITGDYEKIEISLFNLMSNAFKHTANDGMIMLKITETDQTASVIISDTGSGIPEAELPFIFDKFKQAKSVSSASGFGIGLFIVRNFIEKHKGSINCTSVVGQGTSFAIQFKKGRDHFADMPVTNVAPKMSGLVEELMGDSLPEQETIPEVVENIANTLEPELLSEKKTVLIVDDNTDVRNYLAKLFAPSYIIYTAENGLEGLKLVQKHLPDLVISDIAMEGMDGLELCKKIKENDELNHIPVILLTASANNETHLQGINEGADDYITKPFDSDILLAKSERLIKSRKDLRRYFLDSITLKENTLKVPEEYQEFLKKCIEVIEANIDNGNFTIKDFSRLMGMGHRTLYSKIKLISGQTLNAFIRSVKLRRAAVIMLTENINIAQAGARVGFEDQKYFRQQFVKLFGITPSEYIKKYKNSFNQDLNIVNR